MSPLRSQPTISFGRMMPKLQTLNAFGVLHVKLLIGKDPLLREVEAGRRRERPRWKYWMASLTSMDQIRQTQKIRVQSFEKLISLFMGLQKLTIEWTELNC